MKQTFCSLLLLTLSLIQSCTTSTVTIEPSVEYHLVARDADSPQVPRSRRAEAIVWAQDYRVGREVVVWVDVQNATSEKIRLPYTSRREDKTVMDKMGVGFARTPDASIISQLASVIVCPPVHEVLVPGEGRRWRFVWTPQKDDVGEGYLILRLPEPFDAGESLPIIVRRNGRGR